MVDSADPALAAMLRRFAQLPPAERDLVMDMLGTPARDELRALLLEDRGDPPSPGLGDLVAACHSRVPPQRLTQRAAEALSAAAKGPARPFSVEDAIARAAVSSNGAANRERGR
jgi:hypothetical protein